MSGHSRSATAHIRVSVGGLVLPATARGNGHGAVPVAMGWEGATYFRDYADEHWPLCRFARSADFVRRVNDILAELVDAR